MASVCSVCTLVISFCPESQSTSIHPPQFACRLHASLICYLLLESRHLDTSGALLHNRPRTLSICQITDVPKNKPQQFSTNDHNVLVLVLSCVTLQTPAVSVVV